MSYGLCLVKNCANNNGMCTCNIDKGVEGFSTFADLEDTGDKDLIRKVSNPCASFKNDEAYIKEHPEFKGLY